MGVKRRLRKLISGSVQSTKSIGNKTRKTIQSVLHLPSGKKTKQKQLQQNHKCLGNFENSSKLELLSNEFEDDGRRDSLATEFSPGLGLGTSNQTHLVHVHVIPTSTSTSILFEDLSQVLTTIVSVSDGDADGEIHSQSGTSRRHRLSSSDFDDKLRKVNSKHKGGTRNQRTEESIQVISVEQFQVSIPTPTTSIKSKLKKRLSLKGLKKSGKGVGKILFSGFKAMGNSMIYANHSMPVPYECPSSYVNRPGAENDRTNDYDYEEDRKKYIRFWAQALEKQQLERQLYQNDYRHRIDTFQL